MKAIALDVGKARIGVAISDSAGSFAFPKETIEVLCLEQAVDEVIAMVLEEGLGDNDNEKVTDIFIGLPISDEGEESAVAPYIREFAALLESALQEESIPITPRFVDERYTTKMAHKQLHDLGKAPSQNRAIVDQLAAVNILETALKGRATKG